jgi:hypothetical protein
MEIVRVCHEVSLSVDGLRQRYVEIGTERVRAAAVDDPLLAASLHHHRRAVRKF